MVSSAGADPHLPIRNFIEEDARAALCAEAALHRRRDHVSLQASGVWSQHIHRKLEHVMDLWGSLPPGGPMVGPQLRAGSEARADHLLSRLRPRRRFRMRISAAMWRARALWQFPRTRLDGSGTAPGSLDRSRGSAWACGARKLPCGRGMSVRAASRCC